MTDSELREAAARTGTPAYIFDLDEARTRAGAVRAMLGGGIGLCFAMKSNPFLTGALASCVLPAWTGSSAARSVSSGSLRRSRFRRKRFSSPAC